MNKILEDLKKLKDVYNLEREFKIGEELRVKLKTINSEDEAEVHGMAAAYDQGLAYLYAVKKETICRSIVSLNGHDIPRFVEDEVDGVKENVQRHVWLRRHLVSEWSQVLVDEIYNYYAELMNEVERKMGKDIQTEEVEAEIVEEVKKEKESR